MSTKQILNLNPLKKGPDNNYHKLEIPIQVSKTPLPAPSSESKFCYKQVNQLQANSTCQVEFSYAQGQTQVIACLMGPSEAKFSSKQDYSKAFVEVSLKTTNVNLNKTDIQTSVRQCLDQIIQGVNYPKQLLTFQISLVNDYSEGAHVFAAVLNACIILLNQAGIAQKEAPLAALSYIPDQNIQSNRLEIVANQKLQTLWLKSCGEINCDVIFEADFEKQVKKQIKEIINVTFN